MIEMDTLTIVRWRLANGRTIADSDVHKLVAQIDQLKAELSEAVERGNDWCDQAKKARAERDAAKLQTTEAVVALNNRDRERMQAEREARAAEAERDRLREALENLVVAAGMGWPFSLSDAAASARAALKETGHG
jgi:chromosome segregation ATPase